MRERTSRTPQAASIAVLLIAGAAGASDVNTRHADEIAFRMGLRQVEIVDVAVAPAPVDDGVVVSVDGMTFDLVRHSVRSAERYQVLVDQGGGLLVPAEAGPINTYRGVKVDEPGSLVAASIDERGVTALIRTADGDRRWLEPVDGGHVLYTDDDVLDLGHTCGVDHAIEPIARAMPMDGAAAGAGQVCVTELGIDADFEYLQAWGDVAGVEARINQVINVMNVQFEDQVDITHEITTILVRTVEGEPYTALEPGALLEQFRDEWFQNQGDIQRDVAHLFTGKELDGKVIGVAFFRSICSDESSYGLSQSDFNGNFACATDLTAHELGHNWAAAHCDCPSFTMNPSLTCANTFSAETILSITGYRDTRPCLDCQTFEPPQTPLAPFPMVGATDVPVDVQLTWVDGGGADEFEVYLSVDNEIGPEDFAGIVVNPVFQPDPVLEPQTTYFWQVVATNGIGSSFGPVWVFTTGGEVPPPACPGDFDEDGMVGSSDLATLLSQWGTAGPEGDLNGSGVVNAADLAILLGAWGGCPDA